MLQGLGLRYSAILRMGLTPGAGKQLLDHTTAQAYGPCAIAPGLLQVQIIHWPPSMHALQPKLQLLLWQCRWQKRSGRSSRRLDLFVDLPDDWIYFLLGIA